MLPESYFFAEDYLREFAWQDRRFMMKLFAPVILDATGFPLHPLIDTVNDRQALEAFKTLASGTWEKHAAHLPEAAASWLANRLNASACVISYEMPGWLRALLDEQHILWIDIRLSPLRFSLDLMLAVRCSNSHIMSRLSAGQISRATLHREATKMAASARRLMRIRNTCAEMYFENSLVFVGQTAEDASLLCNDGYRLTMSDFAPTLRTLASSRKQILYHPHPYAGEHAKRECRVLADILEQDAQLTRCETSELLSLDADILLTGISSGLLQEAMLFGQTSQTLHRPVCPLEGENAYAQYYLNDLMTPAFWSGALLPGGVTHLSTEGPPDELRKLHALWFTHDRYLQERGPSPLHHPHLAGRLALLEQRLDELETRKACRLCRAVSWCLQSIKKLKRRARTIITLRTIRKS
ncbi:hypothetical protein MXF09_23560 [Klebsiella aerogenes]|uniref:hypothetical protein n=1 Tax=Klebsiella aerogenes TaxID=548 RepID=UPI002DB7CAD2|nr:hypothetical protein [Klebsiella aerogenes]MEB5742674.1 hypothetical protein [Klebsiella aerogenes]